MSQESVYSCLSKASELLAEVHEFSDTREWIVVLALFGGCSSQDIGNHCSMPDFLLCHKLDQVSIFCRKTRSLKVLFRELSKTSVEEVKLNVLCIEDECLNAYSQ